MQTLGVPYPEGYDQLAVADLKKQGQEIADELKASGIEISPTKEMVAMIAYLHKLGRDISQVDTTKTEKAVVLAPVTLLDSPDDLAAAKETYMKICAVCHGPEGKGSAAFPNLTDSEWINGNSPEIVVHSIEVGNPAKGMVAYKSQLSEKQIIQLASYILKSLNTDENSK